jgi:hypothetical protein
MRIEGGARLVSREAKPSAVSLHGVDAASHQLYVGGFRARDKSMHGFLGNRLMDDIDRRSILSNAPKRRMNLIPSA